MGQEECIIKQFCYNLVWLTIISVLTLQSDPQKLYCCDGLKGTSWFSWDGYPAWERVICEVLLLLQSKGTEGLRQRLETVAF